MYCTYVHSGVIVRICVFAGRAKNILCESPYPMNSAIMEQVNLFVPHVHSLLSMPFVCVTIIDGLIVLYCIVFFGSDKTHQNILCEKSSQNDRQSIQQ